MQPWGHMKHSFPSWWAAKVGDLAEIFSASKGGVKDV